MADFGLTAQGLNVPRTSDFLEAFQEKFEQDTGIFLDVTDADNSSNIVVRLIGYYSGFLDDLGQQVQAVVDITDLDAASGRQLTALLRLLQQPRIRATFSQVTLTINGTPGTVLQREDATAEGGGRDGVVARWVATEDITIPVGGTTTGVFRSLDAGAIPAAAGTITGKVTELDGWDSVSNAQDAAVGLDDESDAEARLRAKQSLAVAGGTGLPAIRRRILALKDSLGSQFVQGCVIISNGDSQAQTVQGIAMPANSYLVVVLPNPLTAEQSQLILGVLYDSSVGTSKSASTDVLGTVEGIDEGITWEGGFDYGASITLDIVVTLTALNNAADSVVRAAVRTEVDKLLPRILGEQVRILEVQAALEATGLVDEVSALTLQGVAADFEPTAIQRVTAITLTVNGVSA